MASIDAYGFKTAGLTPVQTLLTTILGSANTNFHVQIYQPDKHRDNDSHNSDRSEDSKNNRHNEDVIPSIFNYDSSWTIKHESRDGEEHNPVEQYQPSIITMVFTKPGYNLDISQILLNSTDTTGVQIILKPIPPANTISASWPDTGFNTNNPLVDVDWAPAIGASLNGCNSPEQENSGVIQGHDWQKYVYCILKFSAAINILDR